MTTAGAGDETYVPVDQSKIDSMVSQGGVVGAVGAALNTITRAQDMAAFAAAQHANGTMRIDVDQVDKLAQFFKDEADAMEEREQDLYELANVSAPGSDPVSTQAAMQYGQVAVGDQRAYLDNYKRLAKIFRDTALELESVAKQTRTDDQNAVEGLGGGNVEA
ncbi:hypothetical protein [Saccharopolyspora sp. 5N708]|uniref:hypothetical protein n=1 Tax=Saccharopolyspora sp. 5N708 TaxID=3457424 RepID=UPI003FCF59D2